tara:strand:- start:3178 stop:3429 length:252 start_codon:yes stop_codon:yes gene_type:complete
MKKNKKVPQLFHESCPYCGIGIQIHRLIGEAYGIISGIASWHGDIPDDIREICRDAYKMIKYLRRKNEGYEMGHDSAILNRRV